jgi:N-methylhydantoinase A/oxoprolinase/acetone carboxylase beta subunit
MTITRSCEARYVGQSHQITVPLPAGSLGPSSVDRLRRNFVDRYRKLYAYDEGEGDKLAIEILTWRLKVSGPKPDVAFSLAAASGKDRARKPDRRIYLPERDEFAEGPVLDRYNLGPGFNVEGPAIVEERESTFVVPAGRLLRVDEFGNLIVMRQ